MQLSPQQALKEMSKEQFIIVDKAVQEAIETGEWGSTGVHPKGNCGKCYGTGKVAFHVEHQRYIACKCVNVKWPEILDFLEKGEKRYGSSGE